MRTYLCRCPRQGSLRDCFVSLLRAARYGDGLSRLLYPPSWLCPPTDRPNERTTERPNERPTVSCSTAESDDSLGENHESTAEESEEAEGETVTSSGTTDEDSKVRKARKVLKPGARCIRREVVVLLLHDGRSRMKRVSFHCAGPRRSLIFTHVSCVISGLDRSIYMSRVVGQSPYACFDLPGTVA